MSRDDPDWQRYERLVACLIRDQLSTGLCVTPNAKVNGLISRRSRQLDVLIDARHETDNSRRIIVDAKRRKRKIDVTHVEAFRGLMGDVGATHGYLVCPMGHTEAAERRAQEAVTLCLLPLDRLQDFDPSSWPKCQRPGCDRGRVFWDGFPEISLDLVPLGDRRDEETVAHLSYVHYVGKCDFCGRFHVLCCTCGELFSLDDDDGEHQCRCMMPWFWMASIESDDRGVKSAELHAVLLTGLITTDRRPIT